MADLGANPASKCGLPLRHGSSSGCSRLQQSEALGGEKREMNNADSSGKPGEKETKKKKKKDAKKEAKNGPEKAGKSVGGVLLRKLKK